MKKEYIAPSLLIINDVCEPMLATGSNDIDTDDNNPSNGGSTIGSTPGINFGPGSDKEGDGYDPGDGGLGDGDW